MADHVEEDDAFTNRNREDKKPSVAPLANQNESAGNQHGVNSGASQDEFSSG